MGTPTKWLISYQSSPPAPHEETESSAAPSAVRQTWVLDLKRDGFYGRHLPSGSFPANAAWLTLAAISHNLLRAAGSLASLAYGKAALRRVRDGDRIRAGQAAAGGGPHAAAKRFIHSCSRCQSSGRCSLPMAIGRKPRSGISTNTGSGEYPLLILTWRTQADRSSADSTRNINPVQDM